MAAAIYQTAETKFLMIKGVSDFGKDKHDPDVVPSGEYPAMRLQYLPSV